MTNEEIARYIAKVGENLTMDNQAMNERPADFLVRLINTRTAACLLILQEIVKRLPERPSDIEG